MAPYDFLLSAGFILAFMGLAAVVELMAPLAATPGKSGTGTDFGPEGSRRSVPSSTAVAARPPDSRFARRLLFVTRGSSSRRRANLGLTAVTLLSHWGLMSAAAVIALVLPFDTPGLMTRASLSYAEQLVLGVVVYRLVSAVNGILEHANIRVPVRLDSAISRLWVTPNMHKVHHSRVAAETDTNYGNLLSVYDRLLGTFTPSERASSVSYGLDEAHDEMEYAIKTTGALLAMPWRRRRCHGTAGPVVSSSA